MSALSPMAGRATARSGHFLWVSIVTLVLFVAGGCSGRDRDEVTSGGDGSVPTGPAPTGPTVMCPYPEDAADAILEEGLGDSTVRMYFYAGGAVRTINGTTCAPTTNGDPPPAWIECFDTYDCGGCRLVLGNGQVDGVRTWYLLPETPRSGTCPGLDGFYRLTDACDPSCAGRVCGDDGCGGTCGSCGSGQVCSSDGARCEDYCPAGCMQGSVCCGDPFCAGDCVGTPCC